MTDKTNQIDANRKTRTHEQVTRTLLKRIILGELPVGTRLSTERTMASEFQVNRATVREALRYLENLELISVRQGDGAYVKHFLESGNLEIAKAMVRVDNGMRLEVLKALLEVRRINSPEVAYTAALNRSADHLERLEAVAFRKEQIPVLERDKEIHHVIGLASGNIIQILMTNFFESFFYAFGDLYFNDPQNLERSKQFHQDIYHAIRDQNAGVARDTMRDALLYAENAIDAAIKRSSASTDVQSKMAG